MEAVFDEKQQKRRADEQFYEAGKKLKTTHEEEVLTKPEIIVVEVPQKQHQFDLSSSESEAVEKAKAEAVEEDDNTSQPLADIDEWEDVKKMESQDEQFNPINQAKKQEEFRNYQNSARQLRVQKFYDIQHRMQTYDFVKQMEKKYLSFNHCEMGIWEALEYLSQIVDESDPDTNLSQMEHALQTAEACRRKHPGEEYDWFHLTGLIHDLGKILAVKDEKKGFEGEPQWAVVGDTFPVGVPFSDKIVLPASFADNPDTHNPKYNQGLGIYQPKCGLFNITMSWGHDEYLYQVCAHNKSTLPLPALYMIRYHSFYPWHREHAYFDLCTEQDIQMLDHVLDFNTCDLYSKSEEPPNVAELAPYYKKIIAKYFPEKLKW